MFEVEFVIFFFKGAAFVELLEIDELLLDDVALDEFEEIFYEEDTDVAVASKIPLYS